MPAGTVKVDRTTKWGNPWRVGPGLDLTPEEAVASFRAAILAPRRWTLRRVRSALPFTLDELREQLHDKNLGCWCKPGAPCHADVLLELANS